MKKIYVSFHVGRGGRYWNQGHLSFTGEEDFQELISRCADKCFINDEDENGNALDDEDWTLTDEGGRVLLEGRDEIEAEEGCLNWDGEYDSDYVTTTDNLNEEELKCLYDAYIDDKVFMSDELKDAICSLKGYKRTDEIKRYPTNLVVYDQNASTHIDIDGLVGVRTRKEWKEQLEEMMFDPISVEIILDKLETCYTNTSDFFAEDED